MKTNLNKAFTLIELAIVIIIVGFVVAGIMAGRELIETSKLRSLGQEMRQIMIAVENFKGKYKYLPGDLPTGIAYGMLFDGDGDGTINPVTEGNRAFFYHLGASGLFKYNPFTTTTIGVHRSDFRDNAAYGGNRASIYQDFLANIVMFGYTTSATTLPTALLTSRQAYELDLKIDDGLPDQGWVFGFNGTSCVDGAWNIDEVNFILNDTDFSCRIYLKINAYQSI